MSATLDTDRFRLLRLQRGLAVRQIALDCGIEIPVLNRLDTGGIQAAPSLTLRQFLRLADCLAVDPTELLTVETRAATAGTTRQIDPALLGAILTDLGGQTPVEVIASALGWTVVELNEAAEKLTGQLRPAGITIFRRSGKLSLIPLNDDHAEAAISARRHPRATARQRLLTSARAKLVFKITNKPLSQVSLSAIARRDIAMLTRVGILTTNEDGHITISDDVRVSLAP